MRDFGAVLHGDADVRVAQRRRIVDAVTDHRNNIAGALEFRNGVALSAGSISAKWRVRPSRRPTARATTALSPVNITLFFTPMLRRRCSTERLSARISSE